LPCDGQQRGRHKITPVRARTTMTTTSSIIRVIVQKKIRFKAAKREKNQRVVCAETGFVSTGCGSLRERTEPTVYVAVGSFPLRSAHAPVAAREIKADAPGGPDQHWQRSGLCDHTHREYIIHELNLDLFVRKLLDTYKPPAE
jgi:hypothetical protein